MSYEEIQRKFLPDVLTRDELPQWFIDMADARSKGKCEFIVWDNRLDHIIYADYFYKNEYLETRIFEVRMKGYKRGKKTNSEKVHFKRPSLDGDSGSDSSSSS